ncbi:MAG: dinuclear metal center YbgI/SA1388 family protein [Methylophilaceae bacterium]|jgi:dinuclear metal center YbgI/SA1388 family protein|tara:strand:+ start:41788 stop:42537 length:750 start_codon:yes stop_codon:yes gene_type:complete
MQLNELNHYLTQLLQPERFNDYCPNGLQVEGRHEVKKVVTGVTASLALLQRAQAANADVILVHHGYFWKGESQSVTGIKMRRLKFLLENDLNLFAYHLPLDAHPEIGNNVMLGKVLDLEIAGWLDGEKNMIAWAELKQAKSFQSVADEFSVKLNREVQLIGDVNKLVHTIAWCTGAAQGYIDQAIAANIDVFVSGEISEQTVHQVRESNTAYIAAGHHATERYGIKALGENLADKFDFQHEFIDINNPV